MNENKLIQNAKAKHIHIEKIKHQNGTTSKSSFVNRCTTGGNKSDLGEHFIAPDGGWGWLVAIASGVSILVTYPVLLQFGILFRKKFFNIGISSSEITTIINTQQAAAMCSGLINGPLFRHFSLRQAALIGNFFVFSGLFLAAFANSFFSYIISISLLYGTGRGIMFSTMTVAVNTYFKNKRQVATAYQYAVAGIGPIVLPFIITFLVSYYGVTGAVLLLSGFSLHNLACSAIYQPAKWHAKKVPESRPLKNLESRHRIEDSDSDEPFVFETCKLQVNKGSLQNVKHNDPPTKKEEEKMHEKTFDSPKISTIFEKIVVIFDLNLLKDFGYVNIVLGLTFMNIIQMNFHYLTPFILNEFGLSNNRIAAAMTVEAICAFITKFLIVFFVTRLKCDNKICLILGCLAMALGRTVLVYSRNNIVVMICFGWIGFSAAIFLVFWILILPSYVPLNRLPAAIGLQRLIMGICNLIIGPFIGLIRDATNYASILHIMNVLIGIVIISWIGEDIYKKRRRQIKTSDKIKAIN
ncbi:monocarboxylate transporter 6-like [Episyrphus balteatus]|uniref:monocarboxylate transporter 6-like n=1 Tax=Episyrphus balteatus TaxID=286459 RepID=UPI0024860FB4|nr:monocarboxylate transporter 6-like [Episyrphus balteatus]